MERENVQSYISPRAGQVLLLAGLYNIVYGALCVLFPSLYFDLIGMPAPTYKSLWQCIGMIVGVYGIGYLVAATNPILYWPITLVGLLGKIFGPVGFVFALSTGELPLAFGAILITNDLLWWIPFGYILYKTYMFYIIEERNVESPITQKQALSSMHINGQNLYDLSFEKPLLLAFVRHSGCTFCRETIDEIAKQQENLEKNNIQIVLIAPTSRPDSTSKICKRYGLVGVPILCDGERMLYRAFGLRRGTLQQLFGYKVCIKAFVSLLNGYGIGALDGDGFQMPGYFYVRDGNIDCKSISDYAGDIPDFRKLCACIEDKIDLQDSIMQPAK